MSIALKCLPIMMCLLLSSCLGYKTQEEFKIHAIKHPVIRIDDNYQKVYRILLDSSLVKHSLHQHNSLFSELGEANIHYKAPDAVYVVFDIRAIGQDQTDLQIYTNKPWRHVPAKTIEFLKKKNIPFSLGNKSD